MFISQNTISEPFLIASIIAWLICTIVTFIIGIFTLVKIKKNLNNPNITPLQKKNIITWGVAYILMGFVILLFMLWHYVITDKAVAYFIDVLLVFLFHIAVLIKIINMEYAINHHEIYKGYYFSFIIVILIFYAIIIPPETIRVNFIFQIIYLILFILGVSVYFISFIIAAIKTSGKDRTMAIRLILFPFIVIIGIIFLPYNIDIIYKPLFYFDVLYLIPQIMMILGMMLMYSTYNDNLK